MSAEPGEKEMLKGLIEALHAGESPDDLKQRFRDLLKESYFYGAQGVLAVSDLTRPATLAELGGWIEGVYSVTGKIPIQILANKVDLVEDAASRQSELEEVAKTYNSPLHLTSAKTGVNVNEAFHRLAEEVAARHVAA